MSSPTKIEDPSRQRALQSPLSIAGLLLVVIAVYRKVISPLFGPHCRFHPTCSSYAAEAITRYGPIGGTAKAAGRIARCHPWNPGGFDPVS